MGKGNERFVGSLGGGWGGQEVEETSMLGRWEEDESERERLAQRGGRGDK